MDYKELNNKLETFFKKIDMANIFRSYIDKRTIKKDRQLLDMIEDKSVIGSLTAFVSTILHIENTSLKKDMPEYPPAIKKMINEMSMIHHSLGGGAPSAKQIVAGILIQRAYGSHKQINEKRRSRMPSNDQIEEIKQRIETMAKEAGFGVNVVPIDLTRDKPSIDTLIDTLGEMVEKEKKENPEGKILKCLPCIEEMFEEISERRGGDLLADSGQLSIKVLFACLSVDIENNNTDMCERFITTLIIFSKLTGLMEVEKNLKETIFKIEKTMKRDERRSPS